MKREDLIDAIGGIDIHILEETQELREKRGGKAVLWPAVAAGIIFFLAVAMVIYMIGNSATSAQPEDAGTNDTESLEITAEDTETVDVKAEDTEAEDSKAPEDTDKKTGEEHGSSDEKPSDHAVSPEKAAPLDENDPQTTIIRLTPYADASDRYVLYTDDHYHVCRIGSPYGGPQAFIMLKNDGSSWQTAAHITSEKTTMSDCVDELKAAAGEFWQYYKTVYPVTEEWIKKAEVQIRENNIAVESDPAQTDSAETFSEEERQLLRDHVVISYDTLMTEAFVPDFIAWEFAYADHGYVRFLEPIFVMKTACPETEDLALNQLIEKDFGSRKVEYYCMSAQADLNGQPNENVMRATPGIREFFDETNPGWEWVNGTGDKVKIAWNPVFSVSLPNCSIVDHCGENESIDVVRCNGEKIKADLEIFTGTDSYVSCSLIILRDGAPASYTIDGESCDSYHIYVSGPRRLTVEIEPEFDLHIGRLEFFLVNDQRKPHEIMCRNWMFVVEQDEEPVMPEELHETVHQREMVLGGFRGNAVCSWLWKADDEDREKTTVGPYTIYYHPGDDLILEGVSGEPGYYRTVLLSGGRYAGVYENGQKIPWIDWQSTGDDMLEFTFCLNEMRDEEEVVAMITTDLSEGREHQAQFCEFPSRLIYEE
ncbi:MAG: hypothetical protein IJL78_05770 [Lachnospiraceae bacterium]|nr:hypothetical protein [Lachnospiraceae bacterium]